MIFKARLAKKEETPLLLKWAKGKRNRGVNFRHFIENDSFYKLIIEQENKPIGVVLVDREGEVLIYLVPRYHGKGLGRVVLSEAQYWIKYRRPSIRYLWADIDGSNVTSIRLFESMGYEQDISGDWYKDIY
jgi:RimJ/RimL family protein N-acetyltransferase